MKALSLVCLFTPMPAVATSLLDVENACMTARTDCSESISSALSTAQLAPESLGMAVGSLAAIAVQSALAQPDTRAVMAQSLRSLSNAAPEPVQARNLSEAARAVAAGQFDATVLRAIAGSPSRQPAWIKFPWFTDMPGLRLGLARRQ